jgi:hypothetical protein
MQSAAQLQVRSQKPKSPTAGELPTIWLFTKMQAPSYFSVPGFHEQGVPYAQVLTQWPVVAPVVSGAQ